MADLVFTLHPQKIAKSRMSQSLLLPFEKFQHSKILVVLSPVFNFLELLKISASDLNATHYCDWKTKWLWVFLNTIYNTLQYKLLHGFHNDMIIMSVVYQSHKDWLRFVWLWFKTPQTYFLNRIPAMNVRSNIKTEFSWEVWSFQISKNTFLVFSFCFSSLFEVGGAYLEQGDVTNLNSGVNMWQFAWVASIASFTYA